MQWLRLPRFDGVEKEEVGRLRTGTGIHTGQRPCLSCQCPLAPIQPLPHLRQTKFAVMIATVVLSNGRPNCHHERSMTRHPGRITHLDVRAFRAFQRTISSASPGSLPIFFVKVFDTIFLSNVFCCVFELPSLRNT